MNFKDHPCFSENSQHTTARIHLPVAPRCNVQCNFCDRKFDCVNESRPGVTSSILTPRQAADYLEKVMEKIPAIAVVGIAGPGDPLANADETLETFRLVKKRFPHLHLCMATNGLELLNYADDIVSIGVDHVTVTVNAVKPEIGRNIYSWVRFDKRPRRGIEAAEIMIENQKKGILKIKESDTILKINTVVIAGVNDHHVVDISKEMSLLGADVHNCIPLYNVEGTPFEGLPSVTASDMKSIRESASSFLKQISHCKRCRADAAGMIGESNPDEIVKLLSDASSWTYDDDKPYVAVASREGVFVNQHLGETKELWIFKSVNGKSELVEKRKTPPSGGGKERWEEMAKVLQDCKVVLVSGSGGSPVKELQAHNIRVITMEGFAEEGMNAIFSGRNVPQMLLRTPGKCGAGSSCGGTGTGCG